ncbi:MAG: SGNH/GDSL hydrolase family protein [Patescibacteria group bacterium]
MKIAENFKNIILVLMSPIIFFLIIEFGFKILHAFSDPEVSPSLIDGLPYENTSNGWFLRYAPSNGWIFYKNNSLGMRDVERKFKKPYGTKRIVCLGDSIMFGGEVQFKKNFSQQLEKMLNGCFSFNIEVLNCGITSYSLREYVIYLDKKGLKFDPDIVIVGLCLNDYASLRDNKDPNDQSDYHYNIDANKQHQFFRKTKRFFLHSYFIEYIKKSAELLSKKEKKSTKKNLNVENWFGTDKYFSELNRLCIRNKIKLFVVIFPNGNQLNSLVIDYEQPQAFICSVLSKLNISYIDLLKVYSLYQKQGKKVFSRFDSVHPLPLGHRIAAEEMSKKIVEEGF